MAVIFDTDTVAPRERIDAFRSILIDSTAPSTIELDREAAGADLRATVESRRLGAVQVLTTRSTLRHELVRTARHVRQGVHPIVSLAVMRGPGAHQEQFGDVRWYPTGSLVLNDLTAPYRFTVSPAHDGVALHLPIDELDLPQSIIHRAAPRLVQSPLYELMVTHVNSVTGGSTLSDDPEVTAAVGRASIELTRALLLSAAERQQAEPPSLELQVRTFVAQHFTEPDLGPSRIAAALNVSARHLYQACAAASISIEQLIISTRLRAAHAALADPAKAQWSIAAVARAAGFRNPTHFSRRFRAEFDTTPSQWRHLSAQG